MSTKSWNIEDQLTFARISGDYNPVHIDPLEARKSIFGKVVVHGVHLALWALNEALKVDAKKISLKHLNVVFRKNVGLEDTVSLIIKKREQSSIKACIKKGDILLVDIKVEWETDDFKQEDSAWWHQSFEQQKPKELDIKDLPSAVGILDIYTDIAVIQQIFPVLYKILPWQQVAFILASTRIVGMECPGMHSIYHELDLHFTKNTQDKAQLRYSVSDLNDVYNLLHINLESPIATGHIKAFVRPVLDMAFNAKEIVKHIIPGEFKDQRALVIGASRGLGAITAKMLALGGAQVYATYFQGKKEILDVEMELKSYNTFFKSKAFDVQDENLNILDGMESDFKPTHLYYFATPFIFEGNKLDFSKRLFEHFSSYYLLGFWRIFQQLQKTQSLHFIMYPSTIALEEMPAEMFEYATAKAAGEAMCEYMRKNFPGINIHCPRLERLATEQTLSVFPVENKNPIPVVLELLRNVVLV